MRAFNSERILRGTTISLDRAKDSVSHPSYGLNATGGMDFDRRGCASGAHGRSRGRAGASARRTGFTDAALEEANADIEFAVDHYELDVHTIGKLWHTLNFSCLCLPVAIELVHEDNVMRVAHGDRNSANFSSCHWQSDLRIDQGLAHFGFEFILRVAAGSESADLSSRSGENRDLFLLLGRTNIGGDTTSAIARNLGVGAIGIDKADLDVG